MKKKWIFLTLLCIGTALSTGSAASRVQAYDSLDCSSSIAGSSKAITNFYQTNENAGEAIADILSPLVANMASNDLVRDNEGTLTNSEVTYVSPVNAVVCVEGALNLRTATTTLSPVCGKLNEGTSVNILSEITVNGNRWYQVEQDGKEGYAYAKYVLTGSAVDEFFENLHEKRKQAAVMPTNYTMTQDISSLSEEDQEKMKYAAKQVNYCLISDYPKAIAEENYMNTYSIIKYILENLGVLQTYASANNFTELLDEVSVMSQTVEYIRERITDETGTSDSEFEAQIDKARKDREEKEKYTFGEQIANYAATFIGWLPYIWGGASLTDGADCSGFCQQIYAHFGLMNQDSANHHSYDSASLRYVGRAVSLEEIQPGDMVCYSGHVAIYYGNGMVVHEPSRGKKCSFGYLNMMPIITIRRLVP